ncbi:unnamed protein product [Phytophthora fragariaefolia]|uniref:Unnamed protein product n=1 Tax=Phytophthora fragariaefolia TaxID=1490495 RepID=A0A9W6XSD9_9STRA|nr:unnamed protein product [Phytophthora fragariaefolia]
MFYYASDVHVTDTSVKTVEDEFTLAQVKSWVESGKSSEDVKKALGVFFVSDKQMLASPQYRYYLEFWLRTERQQLEDWLTGSGIRTSQAWERLRINTIPVAQRESSPLYKAYQTYATRYDDQLFQSYASGMANKWVAKKRPLQYVKKVLSLSGHSSERSDPGTKYYQKYRDLLIQELKKETV